MRFIIGLVFFFLQFVTSANAAYLVEGILISETGMRTVKSIYNHLEQDPQGGNDDWITVSFRDIYTKKKLEREAGELWKTTSPYLSGAAMVAGGVAVAYFSAGTLAPMIGGWIGGGMGYSGVVATNAGLAALGGGSLASGGFGMAGGTFLIQSVAVATYTGTTGFVSSNLNQQSQNSIDETKAAKLEAQIRQDYSLGSSIREDFYILKSVKGIYEDIGNKLIEAGRDEDLTAYMQALSMLDQFQAEDEDNKYRLLNQYVMSIILFDMARKANVEQVATKKELLDLAEQLLNNILTVAPDSTLAHFRVGQIYVYRYLFLGETEADAKAKESYLSAIESEPENHYAYLGLADLYAYNEEWLEASEILGHYLGSGADNTEPKVLVLQRAGQAYTEIEDYPLAIKYYYRAYDEKKGYVAIRSLYNLHTLLSLQGYEGTVETALEFATIERNPNQLTHFEAACEYADDLTEEVIDHDKLLAKVGNASDEGHFVQQHRRVFEMLTACHLVQASGKTDYLQEAAKAYRRYVDKSGTSDFDESLLARLETEVTEHNANKPWYKPLEIKLQ